MALDRLSLCDSRSRRGTVRTECQRKLDNSHFAVRTYPVIVHDACGLGVASNPAIVLAAAPYSGIAVERGSLPSRRKLMTAIQPLDRLPASIDSTIDRLATVRVVARANCIHTAGRRALHLDHHAQQEYMEPDTAPQSVPPTPAVAGCSLGIR